MTQDNIKNLYDALKGDYDLGSEDDFRNSLKDANNRRNLYKAIEGDYDLGSEQDFEKSLGYGGNEERTGNAGRTENTESHTQLQGFTQEEYGRLSPTAQEVAQGVGIAPNNGEDGANGTNETNRPNGADKANLQRAQAREPRAQFVPEASNVVMATPTAETLKRYPWLKADEAVPFNRETGEPLYTWTDEQGRPISRSEIGIRTAKQEITGEREYMQQQPASLELPDSNARAMRLDGSLTEYVDVLMKEKYGDDYLNGTFTTADGRQVSGSELMTETAQQQYNELNNDINNARIEYLDADEGQRKELVDALSKKYQGWLTRESIERTMNDEQAQIEARETQRQRERQQIDEAYNKAYTDRAAVMRENARKAQEEYNNSSWLSRMFGGNPVQRAYWMNQNDKRIQIADTQMNIALDARRVLDTGKAYDEGESWGGRLVRGMRDAMTDTGLYDGGVEEMHDLRNVKEAVDAYEAGTATDAQKDLLDTYSLLTMVNGENADALGGMYGAGQMTIQAIPFMAQMYINPIGSLGQSTMKAATRYGLKTFGRSTMNRYMKRLLTTSLKAGGRVTGDMLAAALPAMTFGAPAIGADMYDRLIGNARGIRNKQGNIEYSGRDNAETSKAAAIAKSIGSNYLEYQSEMVGEYFRPLSNIISRGFGRATDKLGLGKVRDMIANISNKDFYRAYADFARRTQWQGTFNEYLEEVVNNVENALFIGDMDFSTDENGVFNLDTNIDTFLGVAVMSGFMSSLKTVDYIRTKGRLKDALDNAYTSGVDVFGTNEWQRITDEIDGLDDKTAASAVKKMLNNVDSDEKKRTIINYATAALANQGFNAGELKNSLEQVSDAAVNGGVPQDAIPRIENLAPEERQNVHVDGMIHAAVLYPTAENNGQPQEVFITRGNVVMREDGTIDTEASDKEIYYKGVDGQVHIVSPDKLQAVAEPISVEDYVAANRPNEANEPDMAEEIVPGQVVNINVDGQTYQATVQGTDGNGNVSVYYQDANGMDRPATFTIDEIRNANRPNNEEPPVGGAGAVVENAEPNGTNEPNASQTAEDRMPIDVSEYFGNAEEAMATAKDIIQNGEVIGTLPDGSVQMQKDGFVVTLMPDGNGGMNVTGIERTGNNRPQNIPENGNIGAKNIQQTDGISTENGGFSAENIQQEQQIPQDDEGNLIYDQVPVEATIADLYDGSLNDDEVQGFIDANINEAQKKYDSVQKKAPKIGTNKAKYLGQKRKWQADVDEAKRVLDYWNEVNSQNQALTHTTEEETQAAQAELSGQNAREEFNQYNENGVNDAVSVASDFIRGAKITPESFRAETGYGTGEQRRFVGMIASEQNGGKSIDRLAEELVSYDNAELNGVTFNGDTSAAKDAILEALQSAGTRGELTTDNTAEQERYVEARRAELDAQCMEAYGMTYEDYLAYEEQNLPEMLRKYANFDEVEFYNLYADEIEQSLNARINEQGNDTAGEEPRTGGGNEVLPEQGIGNAGGSEGGTEQGTEVPAGVQGTVEDGAVPEKAQQLEPEPIGTNRFGNIYNWVKGQFQSAASFLNNLKSGYLRGVFYRDGIGNIDMVWGNEKAGLQHIINKHIEEADDFNSVEEAMQVINETINNGTISQQGTNISLDYKGYRVSIAQSNEGNWVLTAFDKTRSRAEKQRNKGNATIGDQSVSDMENGTLVSPQLASSESKDTQTSANEQTVGEKIAQEEAKVEQNPTEAQKEAGNYKKGHIKIDGYDVTIENPKGSVRSGVDRNGQEWSVTMNNTYGYIRGTEGVDGDHIDVYLSDDIENWDGKRVFVIDVYNEDGTFDEHKVMLGFNNAADAFTNYVRNYSPGFFNNRRTQVSDVSADVFRKWIDSSHRKTKPFAEYKSVNKDGAQNEGNTLANEAHELFSDIIAQSTHNVEINDSGISETDNTLYAPIKVDGKDTSLSLYQEEPAHSSEEPIVGVSFYRDGMTYQEAADLSDEYNKYVGERVCADGSDELAINFGSIDEAVRFEEWLNDNRGVRFREADNEISDFAQKHNLNEKDVQDYADYMRQGNLNGASGAFHDIRRKIRIDNKGVSLGQFAKIFSPIRKELYEKFGNIDEMREQYVQHELEERSVMEAARKRAEEAAEAERRRLQEFQDMSDEQLDEEYSKAVEANDESRMRDLVNEAARRNGYGDVGSEYQGVGAWSAPSNPGYESDEERRAAVENDAPDVNITDIANGYSQQPSDYFTNLRAYGTDTAHGRESAEAINKAIDEVRNGKDPMVKVYRAVPKSVKEGKLRNGDWVTPSRKYAEMHGDNRLEGDYRIIEQEVPASQLWWDGNDINEWGFDDGKGYAYRNTKNNRKLNDLITRDDKGNIIPLSQRFNARKADVRYRFIGEQGAARLDAAEEATTRLDNLSTARQMEQAYNDKKARIDKLRDSKPVEITGEEYKGKYDLNRDSAQDFILKNLRGEYTIADTGEKVTISKVGAKKVTSHSMGNNAHLKSIVAIPQLLENAIFIEETPNEKSNGKYDSYRYYVVGLKIGNEDYTARITIGVKNGEYYYDHYLTEIEKGNLIEIANGFIPTGDAPVPSYTKSKDTRLISLLQTNDQENARKIKLATGWERGADGKWRYETPDFEYHPNDDARQNDKYKESDWYKELYDLEERLFNGETLTDEETKRFDELAARENEIRDNEKNTERIYLDDYVKDDELFNAYPELKQTRVDFVDLPNEEYSAKYNSEENRITVNQAKSMDVKSVLAHEIQHAIQRIEGFASGSNTDIYRNAATSENVIADINAATGGRLVESGGFNNTPEGIFDALNRKTTYGTILRDNSTELDEVARKYGYETIFDLVNDIGKFKSSVEMYRSEAGEVEARNVQERLNMTPEQRRNTLAEETEDVAREDQQFLQDAIGTSESLASTEQSNDIDTAVADTANKLNVGVRVAHSVDEVGDEGVRRAIEKGRNVKGWYDTRTGEIVVYAPNATDADDAVRTVLHEGVAHYGLRQLVGDENFDTFLDNIYNNVDEEIKAAIDEKAQRNGWSTRVATEEYLASLAEDTNFEAARSSGLWQRIKDFFMDLLTKAGVRLNEALTDNELRYLLWRSYENLAEPGRYRSIMGEVRDIAKQHELNVGNYSSSTDVTAMSAENDVRFREADEAEEDLSREWQDEYDRRTLSAVFKFTEAAQDGMKSVSILQDVISKETDKPIKEDENVWALQNRLSSTNKYEQDYFYENYYKPLMMAVGNLVKAGARYNKLGRNMEDAQDDILKYLISKHGIERNAHFREVAAMEARRPYEESIEEIRKAVANGEITQVNADKQIDKLTEQANEAEEKSRIDTMTRDYSGLSELYNNKMDFDALAEQYVLDFESKFDTADLWNKINAATKTTLRKTYEAGLISRSGYEATRDMYQYYIPLRGWSNDVASEMYNYKGQQGVGGRIMKRAKGRKSLAENPLAVIGRMGQDGILQANKNRVKQRLYNLAIGHDTSLLSISKQWYVNEGTKENPDWQRAYPELSGDMGADEVAAALKEFDEKMKALKDEGMATQHRDGLTLKYHTTTAQEQQHRVNVSIGGREYNIYVNGNPRAAQAINGELRMDDEGNSIIQRVNRWLANVYTSLNPEFVVTNYERDAGFAAAIVAATETPAYQAGWIKNMAKFNPITTGVYINSLIKKSMKAEDRTNEADEATAITEANRRFNEQLARLTEENADRITLWLGRPSAVLRAAGVEDKPMKLYGSKVMKKMRKHGFTLNELKDLPRAVADPIAVFDNYGKDGNRAILTELKTKQGNFLVTLNIGKGEDIDFNIVSSVFGKNEDNIVDWIEKGFATYIDKEKALNYLHHSALRAEALSSPRLISAANIVRNFENPKTNGENEREKSKYERYMREFLANGGETGFTNMLTADDYKKLIKKEIKGVNKPITASKAGRVCFGWAQRANRVFEDATRFATYVTSREQGRSIDRAIRDAKEISLNFNTRGADGMKGDGIIYKFFRNLRHWFIFTNPSIQGLNKAGVAFSNHPVRSTLVIAGLPAILGYGVAALASSILDGDDDEKVREAYMDLPKWIRRTNICIPIGGTKFITIPLSYELRVAYGMGEMFWEIEQGMIEPGELVKETVTQLSDLMPLSFASGTVAQNLSPTIVRPLIDIILNKDFTGRPIYRENTFNQGMPEYTKAYAGTAKWLTKSSEVLNNAMPKFWVKDYPEPDKYTPGAINVNPAIVEHLLDSYLGGLYTFPAKVAKTVSMVWDEDMRDVRNIPFVNRNVKDSQSGNPITKSAGDRYNTYMKEYRLSKQRWDGYRRETNHGVTEFVPKLMKFTNSVQGQRMFIIDGYKKSLDELDKQVKDMDEYEGYGEDEERKRLKQLSNDLKQELVNRLDSVSMRR